MIFLRSVPQESWWAPLLPSGSLRVANRLMGDHEHHAVGRRRCRGNTAVGWALQRIGASDLLVPRLCYTEHVSVWGSISASKEGRRKHSIYPVESSICCVLQSTLCFDENPWKHWSKTIKRLCLLPALLSAQSVAGVMKEHVARLWRMPLAIFLIMGILCRLWYPLIW